MADRKEADANSVASVVAAQEPSRMLSEEEFRAIYRETLKRRREELQQANPQPAEQQAAVAPPPPPPPPLPRQQLNWSQMAWNFFKVVLVASIFANGSFVRGAWIVATVLILKGISFLASHFRVQFVRPGAPAGVDGPAVQRPPASRMKRFLYSAFKMSTTFFVSMSPTWRVENLDAELRADGVIVDPQQ